MALFRLDGRALRRVHRQSFSDEQDLHSLVDGNIEEVFGIRLVASEYPIPNGRIDTLGIDEQNAPAVIEYKHRQDLSAIVQGLFYIDWLRENRRTFELLVREKIGPDAQVNWAGGPRLLIVAEGFDLKERAAVSQSAVRIELKRYSFYGELLSVDDYDVGRFRSVVVPVSREGVEQLVTPAPPSIEEHMGRAKPVIREVYSKLREAVLAMGDDIEERPTQDGVSYYAGGRLLVWFDLKGGSIHLRKGPYKDPTNGRLVTERRLGGYPEIRMRADDDVDPLRDLLAQAYQN